MMISLYGFLANLLAPPPLARLPYSVSELSREDYRPMSLYFTEKEVKRCIEALDFYMNAHGEEMERLGLDEEIACYEDLLYRFMNVPDYEPRKTIREKDRRLAP